MTCEIDCVNQLYIYTQNVSYVKYYLELVQFLNLITENISYTKQSVCYILHISELYRELQINFCFTIYYSSLVREILNS